MSERKIMTFRKDGVEMIFYYDRLVIKKNGLTIDIPNEVLEALAVSLDTRVDHEGAELLDMIRRINPDEPHKS